MQMKKSNGKITELFRCACGSTQHQMVFDYFTDDPDWTEIYISIHLAKLPWYKRIWVAVRYVFGAQSRYGAFEEIVLMPEQVSQLIKILQRRLKSIKK